MTWDGYGNNAQFLAQTIVMTLNQTLSVTNALKRERPEDYYNNAVTVDWPDGAYGQPLVIESFVNRAAVFRAGEHVAAAKEFVRFLVGEGWLGTISTSPASGCCRRCRSCLRRRSGWTRATRTACARPCSF